MSDKQKRETLVSPAGQGAYVYLHEPDKKIWNNKKRAFVETSDDDKWYYKLSVILAKGIARNEEFVADLIRRHEEIGGEDLPSCLNDGDKKPKKQKGQPQKDAPFPGAYELKLKSKYPAALIDTAGNELPKGVLIKAGDTVAAVIALDDCDTDIYTGLVTYLQSAVLVKKNKGHLEAARAAIKGQDFGEDAYVAGGEGSAGSEEEDEDSGKGKKSRRSRDY